MKSYDYEAMTYKGDVYCSECLPNEIKAIEDNFEPDSIAHPIFADSEWDYVPVCCICGAEHDYVTVLEKET